jgi:hypothetical protein
MPVLIVARNLREYRDYLAAHPREVNPVDAVRGSVSVLPAALTLKNL